MNHSLKIGLICLCLVLASFIMFSMDSARADDGDIIYVWDGEGGDNMASTVANWYKNEGGLITNDVAPTSGGRIIYNASSVKDCTFDLDDGAVVAYSFTIDTGYTGTITQAATADIGIGEGGYSQVAGTLKCSSSKTIVCDGDFYQPTGVINNDLMTLVMTGDGKTATIKSPQNLLQLKVSANITLTSTSVVTIRKLNVDAGKILNIANSTYIRTTWHYLFEYSNSGIITTPGNGYIQFWGKNGVNPTINLGAINCPVMIELMNDATSSDIVTLGADTVLGSSLTIDSLHGTNGLTVDPAGYDLTASSIKTGTRGGLLGGEGDITTASWDSSAGTWTPETSNVYFTGTGTVKTAAGQTFYNLTVGAGASVTQSSNVVVSEWMELDGGAWAKGAYTLTAPLMTIASTMTATGTEDAAYSYAPTADQPITSVSVVTNGTWLSIVGTSVVGTPTNAEVGTFYVNVTCTNVIGSVSQNSTITISNAAPVWTTAPSMEWSYGMTYSYDPTASDEGAGLTYSMTSSAPELRCDPASGAIRGKVLDNSITVSLMADDGNGGIIWQNWTITAMGFSWDGDVVVNYTEGQNLKVTFNASLTNATYNSIIKSVQWNFGDGNGSRVLDLMPMHPYARAGTYVVTCYIVTEDDMTATKNFQITVGDPAVVEDLEAQYAERMNQAVLISGLACAAGLVLIACYIKIAGRRGWINRLVPVMILVAMLAISATLIGSAMQ